MSSRCIIHSGKPLVGSREAYSTRLGYAPRQNVGSIPTFPLKLIDNNVAQLGRAGDRGLCGVGSNPSSIIYNYIRKWNI